MGENFYNSSQESLPISQETSNYLWDIINQDDDHPFLENISEVVSSSVTEQSARSSLPAINDWPGDFGFNVTFGEQQMVKNEKHIHWLFSETERKLYVKKDFPCPINFSVGTYLLPGAVVRAMAVYTSPQHTSEAVHRCINHVQVEEKLTPGKCEVEHLVRSESGGATYIEHAESKRYSVVVPFENPPAGQCFSTYIYKFACWGSCSGGPNRRPLTLVFTLEENNIVLGRRAINLKICACPGRDSGLVPKTPQPSSSKKIKMEPPKQQVTVPVPKRKLEEKEEFTLKTSDIECFKFLQSMKKMYKAKKKISSLPKEYRVFVSCLLISSSSSGSSEEDEQGSGTQEQ